jgi:tRNA threonylcarbamoyladenosine biosynthesis protein TsaE
MRESDSAVLNIATADAMRELGQRLANALSDIRGPVVVTLGGELGAGKTTLARGLLQGLGIQGPVRSPTYTLIEPYESANRSIYHLDLYRVADPSEVEELGVRDLLQGDVLLLIEWAEKGASAVPAADLHVQISYEPGDQARKVALLGSTPSGLRLLTQISSVENQEKRLSS